MTTQYHFDLAFIRFTLKKTIPAETTLTLTLFQAQKVSGMNEPQQIKIKRAQRIVELDSLSSFKFNSSGEEDFSVKYEITGNGQKQIRSIPLNCKKMISDFTNTNKSIFEQKFSGENGQIEYKVYLTKESIENILSLPNQAQLLRAPSDQKKQGRERSNSMSRRSMESKRPPVLQLSKKSDQIKQKQQIKQAMAETEKQVEIPSLFKLMKTDSVASPNQAVNELKSIASELPRPDMQKVKELITSHHRQDDSTLQVSVLSYKLKIVIAMLVIGILFLVFDTLSDRSGRNGEKKSKVGKSEKKSKKSKKDHH